MEVRKTVTVLFADVTGSIALGEHLDPESLRGVMSRYFDEMRSAVEAHGGTVEKFIGDAVMAVDPEVLWRQLRAKVLVRRGLHEEAEVLAREAVRRAAGTDFLPCTPTPSSAWRRCCGRPAGTRRRPRPRGRRSACTGGRGTPLARPRLNRCSRSSGHELGSEPSVLALGSRR